MMHKFESINVDKISNLEGNIYDLKNKVDKLEANLEKVTKANHNLKLKLCDSYIEKIREIENTKSREFQISGFSELVALDLEKGLKSPQDIMNCFTKDTLQIEQMIPIENAIVLTSTSKDSGSKMFKIKGSLSSNQDWKPIFSNISLLKDTNLFLDKFHAVEVQNILNEFKKKLASERLLKKKASIKNLTLYVDDNSYEVFSVLKSNFLRDHNNI
jgi:hypothetical protein